MNMKNMKHITILPSGYGHWKITATFRGKEISCTVSDSMAIDDYRSDEYEKDGKELRKLRGYRVLMGYISRKYANR